MSLPFLLTRLDGWVLGELEKFLWGNFVSCPDNLIVQELIVEGHIRGVGFSFVVNHRNPFRNADHHRLKFKIYAILIDFLL